MVQYSIKYLMREAITMNIESTIRENIDKLRYDYTNIYVSPDIPPKKLDNAIAAYARDV